MVGIGYNCNLQLVGQFTGEGAYSQDGPAYAGNCAYYGTDNDISQQQHHGVTVVDASDPRHPRVTAYLDDTASALVPHETVQTYPPRHLLVVAEADGPGFAVYDISDCRHPVLKANIQLPGSQGHMGAFAPDGRTYYLTQSYRGVGGFLYVVDLSDPSHPRELPPWQYQGDGGPTGWSSTRQDSSPAWRPGRGCMRGSRAWPTAPARWPVRTGW